jgi:hypothetical protein
LTCVQCNCLTTHIYHADEISDYGSAASGYAWYAPTMDQMMQFERHDPSDAASFHANIREFIANKIDLSDVVVVPSSTGFYAMFPNDETGPSGCPYDTLTSLLPGGVSTIRSQNGRRRRLIKQQRKSWFVGI